MINRRLFTKADGKDIEIIDGKQRTLRVEFSATMIPYLLHLNDKDVDVDKFENIADAFLRRGRHNRRYLNCLTRHADTLASMVVDKRLNAVY